MGLVKKLAGQEINRIKLGGSIKLRILGRRRVRNASQMQREQEMNMPC